MQKRYIILAVLILFAVLIFFNNNIPPVKFVVSAVQSLFAGPKSALYGIKSGGETSNSTLAKENIALTKKLVDYSRIKKDNEAFRSQFETESTKEYQLLPANVVGFTGRFAYPSTLILDKGTNDNVKSGMAVILTDQLIGKVGKVTPTYSEIILSSNSQFSTVGLTTEGNVPGIVNGQNDFILFDHVTSEAKLTVGETILTKGDVGSNGIGIPPGLIIGKISSVSHAASLPFQNAKVESKIVAARLSKVFIITGI